jgi:hypothetical protein
LPLADEAASLEGKLTWAKGLADSALEKVKPLLDATPEAEAANTADKQAVKGKNSEINRARNHNSAEGRALNKALYVLQGAEKKLAEAHKKLLAASKHEGLDPVLTPKGQTVPVISKQTIVDALRREGKYAGKIRGKLRRSGSVEAGSQRENTGTRETPTPQVVSKKSPDKSPGNNPRTVQSERKAELIKSKSAQLDEARERLERAEKIEGKWAQEASYLKERRDGLEAKRATLKRLFELYPRHAKDATRASVDSDEFQTLYQELQPRWHDRNSPKSIVSLTDHKKHVRDEMRLLEADINEFETRRARMIKQFNGEIVKLEKDLARLEGTQRPAQLHANTSDRRKPAEEEPTAS